MVESAQIKPVTNRNYNTTDHNYELALNNSTKVQAVDDALSQDVPTTLYNFISISDLSDKPEKTKVDVLGVILEIRDTQTIVTRAGRETKKRELQIIDSSNSKINVTFWGEKGENIPSNAIQKIIAIKGGEVSEWQGKTLSVGFSASFELEPANCQEVLNLQHWFDKEGLDGPTQSLTNTTLQLPGGSSRNELVSLAEVKKSVGSSNIADSVKYFNVEASLIMLKMDNVMYRACSTESCRRKVTEETPDSGEFKCNKCDKKYPNFIWRYIVQAAIADFSDFHWVTIFEESASIIIGMSADALARKKENNMVEYEKVLEACKYHSFEFTLKSKIESWNDEKRLRLSVVKAAKVNKLSLERIGRLKSDINRLKLIFNL